MLFAPLPHFPSTWVTELARLDAAWQGGDAISVSQIETNLAAWRQRLGRPAHVQEEQFDIVDAAGQALGWSAPRWFCHLTGLRHRAVHVFLSTPQGLLALQMRAHDKAEWPSLFDASASGHLKAGQDWDMGALAEIEEELGLRASETGRWLVDGKLERAGAAYERYDVDDANPPIRNRQMNQTYAGVLTAWGLANVRFADGEVAGLYLCRPTEARRMVEAGFLIAPGLQQALGQWWEMAG